MANAAQVMDDPVMPPARTAETVAVGGVVCGRLDEGPSYRTVRAGGTTDWLLLVTVSGRGRLLLHGAPDVLAQPGQVVLVEPRTPHDYGTDPATGNWSLRWAHLDPSPAWLLLLDWPQVVPGVRALQVDGIVRDRIVKALDRAESSRRAGLRCGPMFAANAVEEALLWCDSQNPSDAVLDPRLLTVIEYVGEHLEQPHTVESLARVGNLSASRLAHLAAAQLGSSLMQHVERQRIDLARQLLVITDLPIASIARRVGFPDALYFSRRFRASLSMPPTAFRNKNR
jgi:AraC family transcriptional regulator of arabinose operon